MKKGLMVLSVICAMVPMFTLRVQAEDSGAAVASAVSNYVNGVVQGLESVAEQNPTVETFRKLMKPFMDGTPGVFGASLIDTNFVIRQVYFRRDFLAVGYDLKKVPELDYFWTLMREKPAPQLSEPGHGSLIQPRLVAMRVPIMTDGRLAGIVSAMIHTETFLKAVGLDACSAYAIICLDKPAESKGELGPAFTEVALDLPSTKWVIRFKK